MSFPCPSPFLYFCLGLFWKAPRHLAWTSEVSWAMVGVGVGAWRVAGISKFTPYGSVLFKVFGLRHGLSELHLLHQSPGCPRQRCSFQIPKLAFKTCIYIYQQKWYLSTCLRQPLNFNSLHRFAKVGDFPRMNGCGPTKKGFIMNHGKPKDLWFIG